MPEEPSTNMSPVGEVTLKPPQVTLKTSRQQDGPELPAAVEDINCSAFGTPFSDFGSHNDTLAAGADSTDQLIQMFMSELGSESLVSSGLSSSPLTPTSSPPMFAPSPPVSPSLPLPSPSLSPLSQVPTCSSSPASEASPSLVFDDPSLVNCFGLDGLLNDPDLFEIPMSTDSDSEFTFSNHSAQDLDTSRCLPPHCLTPTLSKCTTALSEQTFKLDTPAGMSLPSPPEVPITHNGSPTNETSTPPCHKRKVSETASIDDPSAIKRTKQVVKDKQYYTRRQKNNVASQVSRAKRRVRHTDLFTREKELKEENARLRSQIAEMDAEAKRLKESLINKLSPSTSNAN